DVPGRAPDEHHAADGGERDEHAAGPAVVLCGAAVLHPRDRDLRTEGLRMPGLRFEHVTKEFAGGTIAVNDLSLAAHDGEFMIFVGPSGCGKTTALRMVAGLEKITAGKVAIGDRGRNDQSPRAPPNAVVVPHY